MRRYNVLMLLAALMLPAAAADAQISLLKTIPINGTAASPETQMFSFGISFVDPTTGLYFLADRSNAALDVVDTTGAFTGTSDTLFGQIGGPSIGFAGDTFNPFMSGPNGVAVAPNIPCIFATDFPSRVVSINYSKSFTTLVSSVNTGGRLFTDKLAFDPKDNVILAINGAGAPPFGTLISVDPSSCALTIGKQIIFDAAHGVNATLSSPPDTIAEQPVWQPSTQRFFLSVPEFDGVASRGGVLQITASGTVEGIYQVNFCSPAGLTSGPNGDLLVGCSRVFDTAGNVCSPVEIIDVIPGTNGPPPPIIPPKCFGIANPQEAICNPERGCNGNALVSVPGVGGGDEVWFNSGDGNYYVTAGDDPIAPVIGVIGSGVDTLAQVVPTLYAQPAVQGVVTTSLGVRNVVEGQFVFVHSAGTVHSIAASAANNHVYVALPANTAYPNCVQGCIAVFGVE